MSNTRKTIADQDLLKQASRIADLLSKCGDDNRQTLILKTVAASKNLDLAA